MTYETKGHSALATNEYANPITTYNYSSSKYNWLLQCTEYSHTLSKDVLSVYYRIQWADYRIQWAGFLMLL